MKKQTKLSEVASSIAASYRDDEPINNLKSALLPNRAAIIEGFRAMMPLLFLGYYSTPEDLDQPIESQLLFWLKKSETELVPQLERALRYKAWTGASGDCSKGGEGSALLYEIFEQLPQIRQVLARDVQAAYDGDPAAQSIEEVVYSYPSIKAIAAHRIAHELWIRNVPLVPRILGEYSHSRTGIDIHPGATIGAGFFVDHGTGVVIGESTEIGENVKLYQGVTLGALSVPDRSAGGKRHPTLEDNVTVYAGATILGGETRIGKGAIIGGNIWVTRSVETGTKLFGERRSVTPRDNA